MSRYLDLALTENLWLEAIEPGYPENLDRLPEYFDAYCRLVPDGRTITVHGPYIDIALHSPDQRVREVSQSRVRESLRWAEEIGAEYFILHTNHLPMIRELTYDEQWLAAHRQFFTDLQPKGITILLENMWDPSPDLAARLVDEVSSTGLRLCFDVAHWNVYGMTSMQQWLTRAGRITPYIQLGDNNGDRDADLTLGEGSMDWDELSRCLRRYTPEADVMVGVGIDDGTRLDKSLAFLRANNIYPFGAPPTVEGADREGSHG